MRGRFFQNDLGDMSEHHYGLLSNAFGEMEMTDVEDLLLQEASYFDDETVYTLAAMIEKLCSDLGGEKSINTNWLLQWRDHRIEDRGEYVYKDEEEK